MRQFRLPYDLVIFDLESNQPSDRIIEIGAVKLLRDGSIHPKKFSQLVNMKGVITWDGWDEQLMENKFKINLSQPSEKLGSCQTRSGTTTITELTGITQEMLDKDGISFPKAFEKFHAWAKSETNNILLASWGTWDAPCLRENCKWNKVKYPFRGKSMDLKNIGIWMNLITGKKVKSDGLGSMMRAWDLKFEGNQHRAVNDAYNTALLFLTWWKFYRKQGEYILKALRNLGIYNK